MSTTVGFAPYSISSGSIMWKFRVIEREHPERHPREAEFFNVGDLDAASSLVREIIQNSLDAKLPSEEKVHVSFTFGEHRPLDNKKYYDELIPHLTSSSLLPDQYSNDSQIPFLTIEDFGTSGLDGTIWDEINEKASSNYYNFWRREGMSHKHGQSAGRWGVGKIVYHVASALRSFWGLTVRNDDKRKLLLGKSLLMPHWHSDEKKYDYSGYFTGQDSEPINDMELLQDFCSQFAISRNEQTGLSIVIPMCVKEITPDSITKNIIIHYFFPIIKEMLTVEINFGESSVILNESTIRDIALKQDWEETSWRNRNIDSLMSFVEDAATKPVLVPIEE